MMNGFDGGMMDGWGAFGWDGMLLPLLFWGGLLLVIVWALARIFPRRHADKGEYQEQRDRAEEILRERFARGEIDAEEYGRSLDILRGEDPQRSIEPNAVS